MAQGNNTPALTVPVPERCWRTPHYLRVLLPEEPPQPRMLLALSTTVNTRRAVTYVSGSRRTRDRGALDYAVS
eukprot:scaffold107481_cov63-Phaeocystis_antarctica.AAC.4